jgi:hypothetical protein
VSLHSVATWLYQTPVSTTIREIPWVVAAVQSVHILAIALVLGAALACDLRLAGVFATDESERTVIRRYLPWTWGALVVLLLTGLVMAVGEPDRVLVNSIFWLKMSLVVLGAVLTWLLCAPFMRPSSDIKHQRPKFWVKPGAWLSLGLWGVIIVCGRWIAYAI